MRKRRILLSMALVFMAILVVTTSAFAASEVVEDAVNGYFADIPEGNSMVGTEEFVEMLKNGEDLFVLDIRSAEDFKAGHIDGAYNLPWATGAIADNLDKLPGDQKIYIHCYSGQTANQLNGLLNFAGFDSVSVLYGWNFGISKVEGYEEITGDAVGEFSGPSDYKIEPTMKTAMEDYLYGLQDVSDTMFKNYMISEEMLNMSIESDADMMILSIRQASDFSEGHIPGAVNIPWGDGMNEFFGQLPMDKKIALYCYSGQTAGQTVAGLRLLGYDVVSLRGGMGTGRNNPLGWSNQGYEVVQ